MAERVLVIGGTGPTGVPLVQGLVDRGHRVTILHRGQHEVAETPARPLVGSSGPGGRPRSQREYAP